MSIAVNTRVLGAPMTGVQRYTLELLSRWNGKAELIAPSRSRRGLAGQAWEQIVLPAKLRGRLLFSPSGSGPLEIERQVLTIHDTAVLDCPESFRGTYGSWHRFLLPRLARRAKRIITVSQFIKDRVVSLFGVSPDRVTVIPNGVDTRFRPEALSDLASAVTALRLPSTRYILNVGSLEPRKNLGRLFRAWDQVQSQVSEDVWLVVVGAHGSPRIFGDMQLGRLPARTFLAGRLEDRFLPAIYAGALGMVYPSIYEGFGLPPLEAMASGTPVLVGNQSSLPELVADGGLLVDPFSVDEIADGIYRLVTEADVRATLHEKGLLRARQFSWDEAARTTFEVLQAAAA